MRQAWRWFGPDDPVCLADIRQAGAVEVVTALHEFAPGELWSKADIRARTQIIESAGLVWHVAESLPVSEEIKLGENIAQAHLETYCESLRNLAAGGVNIVCYNFMPVLDWTRTNLAMGLESGAQTMMFDPVALAAFDVFILKRIGAEVDYPNEILTQSKTFFDDLDELEVNSLTKNILSGLPGAQNSYDVDSFRSLVSRYSELGEGQFRKNLESFLGAVVPTAESCGVQLCIHPDDPPFALFGLPRIVSTFDDLRRVIDAVPSPSNGVTLCSGSLGVRPDNNLPEMAEKLGPHIHFLHLRSTRRIFDFAPYYGFFEDTHLGGDIDMVALVKAIVKEEQRRKNAGETSFEIPMRPDHGQCIATDLDANARPGYPLVGRLKGLAEIRGIEAAFHSMNHLEDFV